MCTSTAQLREDKLHYGLGCSSLRIEYHYRNALALITSLNNKAKHGRLTKALLERQTQQLKLRHKATWDLSVKHQDTFKSNYNIC